MSKTFDWFSSVLWFGILMLFVSGLVFSTSCIQSNVQDGENQHEVNVQVNGKTITDTVRQAKKK